MKASITFLEHQGISRVWNSRLLQLWSMHLYQVFLNREKDSYLLGCDLG
jgi:hypothetical protein